MRDSHSVRSTYLIFNSRRAEDNILGKNSKNLMKRFCFLSLCSRWHIYARAVYLTSTQKIFPEEQNRRARRESDVLGKTKLRLQAVRTKCHPGGDLNPAISEVKDTWLSHCTSEALITFQGYERNAA